MTYVRIKNVDLIVRFRTRTDTFCRNEYNVTGLCTKQACPLANSRYATVREHDGKELSSCNCYLITVIAGILYLYMKTVERSHQPSRMWERVKLSKNYETALKQVEKRFVELTCEKFYPSAIFHR